MIFGDYFVTESGRSRRLQPGSEGAFVFTEFDAHSQNHIVNIDSRLYRCQRGVFHYSFVKSYHPNDDQQLPGSAHTKAAHILIDDEKE